ncbi:hypothetical protein GWI72_18755 [Microvirga tunisiensis]|uniref:Uncharacterized protein n=2 Tax=Pannonibacter tanglangensis TaxID=2750084 RepID=A0A7X5JBD7_9HYPH|nr:MULTISPECIES: hypothetical protein [unclassified Pannonibacter]NBN65807.1 hypothetical protein [Pannonibacter sp. XCT-34]NBN80325.1 hypothetical protein [Pannonibacter sp. XCT-53]
MPTLLSIPLTIVPLILYNFVAFGWFGPLQGDPWYMPVLTIEMVSSARFTLVMGDLMLSVALVLLFVEILKATRTGAAVLSDHILSMLVFVAYLIEFLTIRQAATSTFFLLLVIAAIDVIAGFTITITGARRDVSFTGRDE